MSQTKPTTDDMKQRLVEDEQISAAEGIDRILVALDPDTFGPTETTQVQEVSGPSRDVGRTFIQAVMMAAALSMLTTWMQMQVCGQLFGPASKVGMCITFSSSMIALAIVLIRLCYPPKRTDGVTHTLWFVFQFTVGSILFGLALFLLGFCWGLQPDFLIGNIDQVPVLHSILERMRSLLTHYGGSRFPITGYVTWMMLSLWPIVALLYCVLRFGTGRLLETWRSRDTITDSKCAAK